MAMREDTVEMFELNGVYSVDMPPIVDITPGVDI